MTIGLTAWVTVAVACRPLLSVTVTVIVVPFVEAFDASVKLPGLLRVEGKIVPAVAVIDTRSVTPPFTLKDQRRDRLCLARVALVGEMTIGLTAWVTVANTCWPVIRSLTVKVIVVPFVEAFVDSVKLPGPSIRKPPVPSAVAGGKILLALGVMRYPSPGGLRYKRL